MTLDQEDQYGHYHLGDLADPRHYTDALDVSGCDAESLRRHLRMMLLIRRVEETIADGINNGEIACPCHLAIGQEAIAVGVSSHLQSSDRVFGTHRSHAHFLALGCDVFGLFAEILGRVEGCSRGMGGSMHLYGAGKGFVGSVPIVGGTIPLAVGAALAARKDGSGAVAVAYFGDGAAEEGVLHESLNLASVLGVPVLFVCENNLFSSHLHISLRQRADRIGRFAGVHCMPVETVDGNDVTAVAAATGRMISGMRAGEGPAFLEAVTYRWRGHVGPREDLDVGVNRSTDLAIWKKRDPIKRLFDGLGTIGFLDNAGFDEMQQSVATEVADAWLRAMDAPFPEDAALMDLVYAGVRAS